MSVIGKYKDLRLHLWPEPVLLQKASDFDEFDKRAITRLMDKMVYLMEETGGIGLAAPQVGIPKRFFIMITNYDDKSDDDARIDFISNPEILWASKEVIDFDEGCLSLPGQTVTIDRHETINVRYQNEEGKRVEKSFSGIESICFQHENDHLNGLTILDYFGKNNAARSAAKEKMLEQKAVLAKEKPHIYK